MVDRKFKYNSCQQVKHANNKFLFFFSRCTHWAGASDCPCSPPTDATGTNRPIRMRPDIISTTTKIINCIFDWTIEWKVVYRRWHKTIWFAFFLCFFLHKKQFSTLAGHCTMIMWRNKHLGGNGMTFLVAKINRSSHCALSSPIFIGIFDFHPWKTNERWADATVPICTLHMAIRIRRKQHRHLKTQLRFVHFMVHQHPFDGFVNHINSI